MGNVWTPQSHCCLWGHQVGTMFRAPVWSCIHRDLLSNLLMRLALVRMLKLVYRWLVGICFWPTISRTSEYTLWWAPKATWHSAIITSWIWQACWLSWDWKPIDVQHPSVKLLLDCVIKLICLVSYFLSPAMVYRSLRVCSWSIPASIVWFLYWYIRFGKGMHSAKMLLAASPDAHGRVWQQCRCIGVSGIGTESYLSFLPHAHWSMSFKPCSKLLSLRLGWSFQLSLRCLFCCLWELSCGKWGVNAT